MAQDTNASGPGITVIFVANDFKTGLKLVSKITQVSTYFFVDGLLSRSLKIILNAVRLLFLNICTGKTIAPAVV